jgi:ABC-type transporter Mla subunit MlaD
MTADERLAVHEASGNLAAAIEAYEGAEVALLAAVRRVHDAAARAVEKQVQPTDVLERIRERSQELLDRFPEGQPELAAALGSALAELAEP